jgi:uncharacterized damage-inducible protein DinB
MPSTTELLNAYLAGPALLKKAVADLSREQLVSRPIAGKWSALEVVCHLADFEPVTADRVKRVLSHEKPTLLGADESLFAASLLYQQRDVNEELALIEATRAQLGRILRAMPAEAFQRVGNHNERGEVTVERLLTLAVNHIPHHVTFLNEKRKAMGLAEVG